MLILGQDLLILLNIFLPTIPFKNVKAIHYVFFLKISFSSKNSSEVITGSWGDASGVGRHSGRVPVSLWGGLGDSVFYLRSANLFYLQEADRKPRRDPHGKRISEDLFFHARARS